MDKKRCYEVINGFWVIIEILHKIIQSGDILYSIINTANIKLIDIKLNSNFENMLSMQRDYFPKNMVIIS